MNELLDMLQHDSYGSIEETLQFFLEECSLDEAPTADEVAQWRDILQQRGGRFLSLAQRCQAFIDGES